MPRRDDCERDDTVRIAVNLGPLTIDGLADAIEKIERRARAVNAPNDAVVNFDTSMVQLGSAIGPDTNATIEWALGD